MAKAKTVLIRETDSHLAHGFGQTGLIRRVRVIEVDAKDVPEGADVVEGIEPHDWKEEK